MMPDLDLDAIGTFMPLAWPQINPMISFGVLLAFGTLGGMLASRLRWLPTITGFMALGLLIGPSGLGLMPETALADARVLVDIALGLILFKLGATLHPWQVARNRSLVVTSLIESLVTFVTIASLMLWLGAQPVVCVIAAAIAVSSSPAVLIHVVEELRAKGPTVDAAEALVAMNNVFAFLLFSISLPLALHRENFSLTTALLLPAYQLLGATVVGIVVAWFVARIARATRANEEHFRFALVVGAVLLALGLAVALKVSILFTSLTLGVACRSFEGRTRLSTVAFGGGGDVFFIILFAYAGANLHLDDLWQFAAIAGAFVAVRVLAKCVSIYICGRAFGHAHRQSIAVGLLLVPMAGLAIGLVQTTSTLMPDLGAQVSAVVLGGVAVFETIGPPLATFALRLAGEVPAPKAASAAQMSPAADAGPEH